MSELFEMKWLRFGLWNCLVRRKEPFHQVSFPCASLSKSLFLYSNPLMQLFSLCFLSTGGGGSISFFELE